MIQDREILGFTAKQHLANDGVHYEPRWFTSWTANKQIAYDFNGKSYPLGDVIYTYKFIKIGFEICEDAWRDDDRPASRHMEKGVNLILNPSASHFAFGKTKVREDIALNGSEDYKCVYLYANLVGNETGRMIFDGEILIAKDGRLVAKNELLTFKNVDILGAEIDFEANYQDHPEASIEHDKNEEFAQAEALALFDYMRKSRSNGFVLSLSGGADSSSCAVLVAEMVRRGAKELGLINLLKKAGLTKLVSKLKNIGGNQSDFEKAVVQEILTTAYQGTVNSSDTTFNSAKNLAESIGATFYNWNIDEEVASYTSKIEKAINKNLTWENHDIALQNIQARARSPIIWILANINNALLLATSNRSEGDVGYATMDGDTSGSISPIAAVDKQFIISWLKWAETELGYCGLHDVNSIQPTAELRPLDQDQTDEDDLMPYFILLEIEKLAIGEHKSPKEVFSILKGRNLENESLLKTHIKKFYRLWSRNQWKRERLAPAFHLDDFNVDPKTWCRFPILSGGYREELDEL